MELIETLNRTMKLAMDDGRVSSYEEAQTLFGSFRLRIHVQSGFSAVPAAEAAAITLLNAAPKTFLGGVELVGPLHEQCTMAWFAGKALGVLLSNSGWPPLQVVLATHRQSMWATERHRTAPSG